MHLFFLLTFTVMTLFFMNTDALKLDKPILDAYVYRLNGVWFPRIVHSI